MADVHLEAYTPDRFDEWNQFVDHSNEGTIFHRMDFLAYHPPRRFDFHHLMFSWKGRLVGVLPMAWRQENGQTVAVSPSGASFGGLLLGRGTSLMLVEEILGRLIEHLASAGLHKVRISPPPAVYHDSYSAYVPFALLHDGFRLAARELTSVVHLPGSVTELDSTLDSSCRYEIRKARRHGVEVSESTDYETFYEMLCATKRRHNAVPTHTLEELQRLADACGPRMRMYLAFYRGEPVAGILCFACNSRVCLSFYHCHRQEFGRLSPTNLLLRQEMEWAVMQGFKHVDFGITTIAMEINGGLLHFKESFGAVGDLRDTYERDLDGH